MTTTSDTHEIRELTGAELDLATGGSIVSDAKTALWVLDLAACLIMGYATVLGEDIARDPWG